VRALPPVHGRVNLAAARDGQLDFGADALLAVNLADEALTVATLMPRFPVREGDVVATVKVIPFAVPGVGDDSGAAGGAAAGGAALAWRRGGADRDGRRRAEREADGEDGGVTAERLARVGLAMRTAPAVRHASDALAEALQREAGAALVLVAGASATTDRADVTPEAIRRAGGTVSRVGMPADPGNLLVLGALGDTPVLGLPGCARSPARNGLDLVLERLAAGLAVSAADVAAMGVGGLLAEGASAVPWGWR
jgi:molybdenum cofactor cytidylyltransferase